jgi:hypothetical protein
MTSAIVSAIVNEIINVHRSLIVNQDCTGYTGEGEFLQVLVGIEAVA